MNATFSSIYIIEDEGQKIQVRKLPENEEIIEISELNIDTDAPGDTILLYPSAARMLMLALEKHLK